MDEGLRADYDATVRADAPYQDPKASADVESATAAVRTGVSDLVRKAAVVRFNNAIALCVDKGDNGTREMLAEMLTSEEDHLDWLETQLTTIEQIGLQNYLAQQLS